MCDPMVAPVAEWARKLLLTVVPALPGSFPSMRPYTACSASSGDLPLKRLPQSSFMACWNSAKVMVRAPLVLQPGETKRKVTLQVGGNGVGKPQGAPCLRAWLLHAISSAHPTALPNTPRCHTHLTLLNTMSTSVLVTAFPSITPHSLHILEKFFPVISLPLAAVSPYTANLWKASSTPDILLLWRKGRRRGRSREGAEDHLQLPDWHSHPTCTWCSAVKMAPPGASLCHGTAMATQRASAQNGWDPGRDSLGPKGRQRRGGGGALGHVNDFCM